MKQELTGGSGISWTMRLCVPHSIVASSNDAASYFWLVNQVLRLRLAEADLPVTSNERWGLFPHITRQHLSNRE